VSKEKARLFVALELPPEGRAVLIEWRAKAVDSGSGLRFVTAESLHVTLCFLGWQAASEIDSITAACGVAASHPAAELAIAEAMWLPPRRPRVLAVRLEDPAGAAAGLQSALSDALARGRWYEPEARPFLAHVTVARVAKGTRVSRDQLAPPGLLRLRADTVVLYRSRLGSAGARYEPLARFELAGRGA